MSNKNPVIISPQSTKEADISFVRDNLYDLHMKGAEALTDLIDLAKSSQDYHMYDSVAKLIISMNTTNTNLTKLADLDPNSAQSFEEKNTINNTMNYVGTSSDFLDIIMEKMKEKKDDIAP